MATTEKIIIEIDVQNNTLKDTEDKIKKVSGALVKMRGDEKASENQIRATEAELRLLNKTYREQDRVLQASIKANQAAEGSMAQLKAQYVVAQAALNNMSAEQRENTQEGKDQIAEVGRLNAKLKEIESSYGQNARNVGNYSEAVKPLRVQLRELTQQLQQLEAQGRGNSAEFQALSQEAGRIKDSISDVNNTVKALSSDTGLIDGFAQGISGVAGAFSVAQGAAALFGDENKNLQETLVKIQATMAIANGVQQVANALQKDSAFMVAFNTTALKENTIVKAANSAINAVLNVSMTASIGIMNALGVSTVATSAAFGILSTAIAATGIGAFIIIAGYLIKQISDAAIEIYNIVTATTDYEKTQLALNRAIESANKIYKENITLLKSENDERQALRDLNIDLLKSQGASEQQLRALQSKNTKQRIKDLENERITSTAVFVSLSKLPLNFAQDLVKSNEEIRKYIKVNQLTLKQGELDALNDIIVVNNAINETKIKTQIATNEALLKNQEDYNKARLDALKTLQAIEDRIFSENNQYKLTQLQKQLEDENKIISDALAQGLITQAQADADRLALQQDYANRSKAIIKSIFDFESAGRDEQSAQDIITDEKALLAEQDYYTKSLALYKTASEQKKNVNDEENKGIEENQKQITDLFLKSSDAINLAFTNSLTDAGLDVKKFQKQFIAIMIDTIEGVLLLQAPALLGSLTATLGVPGGFIAYAAISAVIKGLFALAKNQITQFEDGGIIPKAANGMLVGNSHAQGGIKIGTPSGMIEAEGGEVIINKRSSAMFKPILSAINEAGGGVKFANGGAIFAPTMNNDFNMLSDIFAKMPNPVVSVVDINNVQSQVKQVQAVSTL
jgi:hypothetical protein